MNGSKEAKSAAKGQKKLQKTNKKQQQKQQQQLQQQQQQQQLQANGNKNGITKPTATNAKAKTNDTKANNHNNNNHMVQNNNNNSQSTQIAAGGAAPPPTTTTTNITQKFKEQYELERRSSQMTASTSIENLPTMERTRSFRGKLSKFINHLTGSKENLARTEDSKDEAAGKTPFTFTRSRSMILLRRPNRRSFIEPQLEQLSEEAEKSGDPMSPASPRKNSLAESNAPDSCSPILRRRADTASSIRTPPRRQSTQALTSTPLEESPETPMQRKASTVSLAPNDPQKNFQKRRSNTLIASFKSSWVGLGISAAVGGGSKESSSNHTNQHHNSSSSGSSDKKKDKLNPKWSASLQSLQAIDNMVSYANMSFIDYDKFNGYEKQLERQHSIMSLAEQQQQQQPIPQLPLPATATATATITPLHNHHHHHANTTSSPIPRTPSFAGSSLESTPRTVVMRRKRSTNSVIGRQHSTSTRNSSQSSFNLDTDFEHNLDRVHNVYRESLDSRTLELLNQRSRNSYIQDQAMLFDALNLEDGSASRRCALCAQRVVRANSFKQQRDIVDGRGQPKQQVCILIMF